MVAGEPIRGSWWAHPKSHAIFRAATSLSDHDDVIAIPLINSKITFVHRRLWPALVGVALAREPWQIAGLSPAARALLKRVEREDVQTAGPAARDLERRLLAVSREIHTDRGAHAKILQSWKRWAKRMQITPLGDITEARREIERAAAALGGQAAVPWSTRPTRLTRPV